MNIAEFKKLGYRAKARAPKRVPGQMNKTETLFAERLEIEKLSGKIICWWYEMLTFKLGKDLRYTPDFVALEPDGNMTFYEIKAGFVSKKDGKIKRLGYEDSIVKLKMCAELFPFDFCLAIKASKQDWKIERIG